MAVSEHARCSLATWLCVAVQNLQNVDSLLHIVDPQITRFERLRNCLERITSTFESVSKHVASKSNKI